MSAPINLTSSVRNHPDCSQGQRSMCAPATPVRPAGHAVVDAELREPGRKRKICLGPQHVNWMLQLRLRALEHFRERPMPL